MEIRDVSWVFPRILISFESYTISRSKSISDNQLGTQTLIMSWVIKVLRIEWVFYCTCADAKQYSAKDCKILKYSIRQDMGPECKLHAVKIRKLPPSSCIFSYEHQRGCLGLHFISFALPYTLSEHGSCMDDKSSNEAVFAPTHFLISAASVLDVVYGALVTSWQV